MQGRHEHFMDHALALARQSLDEGNGPAGCVITRDGQVIGTGRNLVNTTLDPTAHGEMLAIRDATRELGTTTLAGVTLYTVIEPCPMCCWAMINAKISTLVLGARHARFNRRDLGTYATEGLLAMTGRRLEIITGVREKECEDLQYAALELRAGEMRLLNQASAGEERPAASTKGDAAAARFSTRMRRALARVRSEIIELIQRRRSP